MDKHVEGNGEPVEGNEEPVEGNEELVEGNEELVEGNEELVEGNEEPIKEKKGKKVTFNPFWRTFSKNKGEIINPEVDNIRKSLPKGQVYLHPHLRPTYFKWHDRDLDKLSEAEFDKLTEYGNTYYTWPSQDPKNTQSKEERDRAQKESDAEAYARAKNIWNIEDVKDDGNATLCNIKTGVCIAIAISGIAVAKASGMFGGKTRCKKTRCKKTQCKKTRRNRKK